MTISGEIEDIRFRNDENGYTILTLDYEGEPTVCVGTFAPICEGQSLTLEGAFVVHSKFGRQFKVERVVSSELISLDGIIRYLGSGIIKGVGEKTALSIVNAFGVDTLKVLEFTPHRLTSIRGISKAKALAIGESYKDAKQMENTLIFLQGLGLGLSLSFKIYKLYGDGAEQKIRNNPYILIEDVDGIGFATADKIATNMGVNLDSAFRICAGLIHVLKEASEKNGNTFLPKSELVHDAAAILKVNDEFVESSLEVLCISGKIKPFEIEGAPCVMLRAVFSAEYGTACRLLSILNAANKITYNVSGDVSEFEKINGVVFHDQQKEAIDAAVNNGIAVITGGPGTGKTTIIKCILSILKTLNKKVMLLAPTGRAAKRLSESTGEDASTIHRALLMNKNLYESREKITADAVIVDEFSMVDIFLFHTLLGRMDLGTRLILVGDKDQLPSVGAGNVLSDVMSCGLISVTQLTKIFRQEADSLIVTNAHNINAGIMPDLTKKSGDFFFVNAKTPQEIASVTIGLAEKRLPNYLKIEPYKVQVLAPLKNGAAGTIALNAELGDRLNPGKPSISLGDEILFREGDKVMHITNNYQLEWHRITLYGVENGVGVFNGDIGVISKISRETGEISVTFEDGRRAEYTPDIRNQLTTAYAITVHKSQGSEFDAVIIPVTMGNPAILTRNLLYTAITRAKKLVVLVGEPYSIKRMVENDYIAKRYSALKYFIKTVSEKEQMLFQGEEDGDFAQ